MTSGGWRPVGGGERQGVAGGGGRGGEGGWGRREAVGSWSCEARHDCGCTVALQSPA